MAAAFVSVVPPVPANGVAVITSEAEPPFATAPTVQIPVPPAYEPWLATAPP